LPKVESDRRYFIFYMASLLGVTVFWFFASQTKYVQANFVRSQRYITIAVMLVAFWVPLALYEMVARWSLLSRLRCDPAKILLAAAVLANLVVAAVVIHRFQIPRLDVPPPVQQFLDIARNEKADVIMSAAPDDKHIGNGGYWAIWALLFHSLGQGQSFENAIIPIVYRCSVLQPQIHAALAARDSFRALCLGGDPQVCLKQTMECGFLDFNDQPRIVGENSVTGNSLLTGDNKPIKISTLEFTKGKGNIGNLIKMLSLGKPATLTSAGALHFPPSANPYGATYGPYPNLELLPGNYRLSLNCMVQDGNLGAKDALADLAIVFPEKNLILRKVNFRGSAGLVKQSFIFNVPDFKLFFPQLQFLLTTSGKATLDCDEFRITPL
jgi:hypothetical protein